MFSFRISLCIPKIKHAYKFLHHCSFFVFYELINPRKNDDFDLEFFPGYFRYLSSPPNEREKTRIL